MSEKLRVTRTHRYKREADRDAKWFKKNGGTYVKVTGSRGMWFASGFMPLNKFAKFCALEAKREESKP